MSIDEAIEHAREVAKKNREAWKNCSAIRDDIEHQICEQCAEEHEQLSEWLEELKKYKDLEEKGLLLRLPCKVGDTVYTNTSMQGWYFRKENRPYAAKIVFIGINGANNYMNVDFENGRMLQFKISEIGKTVFLSQAEAEEALKEF